MRNKPLQLLFLASLLLTVSINLEAQTGETFPNDTTYSLKFLSQWDNDSLVALGTQTFNDIWGWTDDEGHEYVILGSTDSIYFFEVTDPYNPVLRDAEAGRFGFAIHRDFKTYKHYCYAVCDEGNSSLQIFDMQYLPDSVHKVYDDDTLSSRAHNVFISGDRIYFASNKTNQAAYTMSVASLADPENPVHLSHLIAPEVDGGPLFDHVHDVYVVNDTAYCSNGGSGFYIFDYRDPFNPVLIGSLREYKQRGYNHSSWRTENGRYAVFADENWSLKLKVVDVSDPAEMKVRSLFGSNAELGSIAHNPFIKGNLVYISYYHDGLQIFDIGDPDSPKYVAGFDTYPQNEAGNYNGYEGCWGVYPFFPSGTIAASDMTNGLFLFRLDTIAPAEPSVLDVKVYPNPLRDHFTIEMNLNREAEFTISFYDLWGRFQGSETQHFVPGRNKWQINMERPLPNGMFIARIEGPGINETLKLVKADH